MYVVCNPSKCKGPDLSCPSVSHITKEVGGGEGVSRAPV